MSEVKDYIVSAIKPNMVPIVWPMVEDMLKRPLEHSNNELNIETVFMRIIKGDMLLVTISKGSDIVAAIAIEQTTFDTGKKIMNLTLVGGDDMHEWMHKFDEVTQNLAKDYGCEEIYIIGRKGWVRALRSLGFDTVHTVVSKKVGG